MRKAFRRLAVISVFIVVMAAVAFYAPKLYKDYIYPLKYSEYVSRYSEQNNFDELMVYAVIKTESGFDCTAESGVGARGLMQIMDDTYEWIRYRMKDERVMSFDDMYSPEYNIEYGTYMLSILYEEYGSYETALAAYHAGRGTVNSWLKNSEYSSDGKTLDNIPSTATEHYVNKAMRNYKAYTNLYT